MRSHWKEMACAVPNCPRPVKARSLCIVHYNSSRLAGTLPPKLKTHGHTRDRKTTKEYRCWSNMIKRCGRTSGGEAKNYQARGIIVCERWREFSAFLLDMGFAPGPDYSIERINNDGGYEPGNCRWATAGEQARNTRRNHWLVIGDRRVSITDAAKEFGIHVVTLRQRLARGMSIEAALLSPKHVPQKRETHRNVGLVAKGRSCL